MKKGFVSAATLVFLLALAPAYAQTTDFFELVRNGTPQSVQAAISQGADVKAQDVNGTTPLHFAAQYNHKPEVITVLVKAGADVNAKDPIGLTPLMYATNGDNPEVMIRAFLKAGADAKAKDSDGKTAFDYAQTNEKLKGTDAYRQLQQASQ